MQLRKLAQSSLPLSTFKRLGTIAIAALFLAACQSTPQPKTAAKPQVHTTPVVAPVSYAPPTAVPQGYSALVLNASTGEELYAVNADAARFPASLSKMMTLYLLYEEVSNGRYSLSSPLKVSANAASQPPARIGLKEGMTITVEQAARALSVKSANDVAITVAENIAGNEAGFAARMTSTAKRLGLSRTRFVNASGLPDPRQVTSARDMAKLGLALKRRFPQYGDYYKARSFIFQGRKFEATNNLLGKVRGVDGLKTGYIKMAGYNLVATASRSGKRLIVVVMGGESEASRDRDVTALINQFGS